MSDKQYPQYQLGDLVKASCFAFRWTGVVVFTDLSKEYVKVYGPALSSTGHCTAVYGTGELRSFHVSNLRLVPV